jgi:hypothetical protein
MKKALLRKFLSSPAIHNAQNQRASFNNKYEIPFIFGISKDSRTIYFDRRFPRYFKYKGRILDNYALLKTTELVRITLNKMGVSFEDSNLICGEIEHNIIKKQINWDSEKYAREFLSKYVYDLGSDYHKKLPYNLDTSDLNLNDQQKSEMLVMQRFRSGEVNKLLTTPHQTAKIKRKKKVKQKFR